MTLKNVDIYADGASLGTPGPGGYGVILKFQGRRKELSGGYRYTTNNRMEMLAAIVELEALKERCQVTLYSDSEYLVNAVNKGWAKRWRAKKAGCAPRMIRRAIRVYGNACCSCVQRKRFSLCGSSEKAWLDQ